MRTRVRASVRAFTLLEVMIVIVIILAIAALVTVNLMSSRNRAQENTVRIQLNAFKDALRQFNLEFNRYPTDEEGLEVLWSRDALDPEANQNAWRPFMDEPVPNDPWGSPWGYRAEGETAPDGMFDLWSYGPDREDGTDDDILLRERTDEDSGISGPL